MTLATQPDYLVSRGRRFILVFLLVTGLAGIGLWAASYARITIARFPWPATGGGQTWDRGFLLLVDGRLGTVRQKMTLAPGDPSVVEVWDDSDRSPQEGEDSFLAGDARTLGTFLARRSIEQGTTRVTEDSTLTLTNVEAALSDFSWRRLGFGSAELAAPRLDVEDATVTGRVSATVIPLWPMAALAIPGLILIARARRGRAGSQGHGGEAASATGDASQRTGPM